VISFALSESGRLFERRRAEEVTRAKDELLGVTSHELRTPLNAIFGWRMLRSGGLSDDKRARALETIERNAKIQVQLVEDLLDFNRVSVLRGNGCRTLPCQSAFEDVPRAARSVTICRIQAPSR